MVLCFWWLGVRCKVHRITRAAHYLFVRFTGLPGLLTKIHPFTRVVLRRVQFQCWSIPSEILKYLVYYSILVVSYLSNRRSLYLTQDFYVHIETKPAIHGKLQKCLIAHNSPYKFSTNTLCNLEERVRTNNQGGFHGFTWRCVVFIINYKVNKLREIQPTYIFSLSQQNENHLSVCLFCLFGF